MSLGKLKTANINVVILVLFALILYGFFIVNFIFAWIPAMLTFLGAGITVTIFSLVQYLETFHEGAKPNIFSKKDRFALINTIFLIINGIFGLILVYTSTVGNVLVISEFWRGAVALSLIINWGLTARELIQD